MKILHYISDLHLEKRASTFPVWHSPQSRTRKLPLFLAGDIGNPKKPNYAEFLGHASDRYARVFLVPGNHEFWGQRQETAEANKRIRALADSLPNVSFLNRQAVEFQGAIVAGCTLWTPATCAREYIEDIFFLHKQIKRAELLRKKLIIMTHHLPTRELIDRRYANSSRYKLENWASRSESVFSPSISAWICGHTHDTINKDIGGVRFLVNSESKSIAEFYFNK